MKYYIIAGEASGDLHGSNLMKAIIEKDPSAEFRFWGGDKMAEVAKNPPVKHYKELAFMGFIEVIQNLKTILGNISFCKKDIEDYQPDAMIFIDYPGFNLRVAEFAKKKGIKTVYYISPQIWAWKKGRIKQIRANIDKMLVILPFEKGFYKELNYKADFVGHPLLDAVDQRKRENRVNDLALATDKPIISLLPGSRKQEISSMLPLMIKVSRKFPDYQFCIACAPSQEASFYQEIIGDDPIQMVTGKTYDLLEKSHAAIVTSGTATLEAALFNVPEVVVYKGSQISYWIARQLVKVKYISLVNLIMDRLVVTELIQGDYTLSKTTSALREIIEGPGRAALLEDYKKLYHKLGGVGASENAADIIVDWLNND